MEACAVVGGVIGGAEEAMQESELRSDPFAYDSALNQYYHFGPEDCRIYRRVHCFMRAITQAVRVHMCDRPPFALCAGKFRLTQKRRKATRRLHAGKLYAPAWRRFVSGLKSLNALQSALFGSRSSRSLFCLGRNPISGLVW